jgi:hypothetical protein
LLQIRAPDAGRRRLGLGTMRGVNYSILRPAALVLGACLLLAAVAAEARPPRWQTSAALERILAQAQGRMSDAERQQLRRDLSASPRGRGRDGAAQRDARRDTRMSPQQRDSLRRDMRDANRQLDRNPRRGGKGQRNGNGGRERGRR